MASAQSNSDLLTLVGSRLRAHRLERNLRIEDVARTAGIGTATVKAAERGDDIRLSSLIKLLRALDRVAALESFLPPPSISPVALSKLGGKPRQRARRSSRG